MVFTVNVMINCGLRLSLGKEKTKLIPFCPSTNKRAVIKHVVLIIELVILKTKYLVVRNKGECYQGHEQFSVVALSMLATHSKKSQ